VSTAPTEIDDIRRRMAQIRRELHEDVQGVVAGAEAATDWRRWIRNYPWISVGLAFGVGYILVPRRHRETPAIHITHPEATKALALEVPRAPEKKKKSLIGKGLGLLAPVILRAAQGYALQFFEQWMAQRLQAQGQQPFDFAAAFGGHPGPAPTPGPAPGPGGQPGHRRF